MASSSSSSILSVKSVCVVTGASQGIGRAIAIGLAEKFTKGSLLVLTARNTGRLEETRRLVQAAAPDVRIHVVSADLTNQATFQSALDDITQNVDPTDFQHALLINNAGNAWDSSRYVRQLVPADVENLQEYWMLNVTAALLLTSHFLREFPERSGLRRTVVNISSLFGVAPTPCFAVYGMAKAARNLGFKVIATEDRDIRVLSYNPGAVETPMLQEASLSLADQSVRDFFSDCAKQGMVAQPEQAAALLIAEIEKDEYESGAFVSA